MKLIFLTLLLLFGILVQSVRAGSFLSPQGVVGGAIASARDGRADLFERCCDVAAITADPTQRMTRETLVTFFKELSMGKAEFDPKTRGDGFRHVTVTMMSPRRIDFVLVGTEQPNGTLWRIVAVHLLQQ